MVKTKRKNLASFSLRCPMEYVGANAFTAPAVMDGAVQQKAFPGATVGWGVMVTNFFLGFESVFLVIFKEVQKREASRGYFFLKCVFCNVTWKFSRLSKRESIPEQQVRCASTSYVSLSDDRKRSHSKTRVIALYNCERRQFDPLLHSVSYLITSNLITYIPN